MNRSAKWLLAMASLWLAGCAGLGSSGSPNPPPAGGIAVSPASAIIRGSDGQQFTVKTSDGTNPTVTWAVNGTAGGNASLGIISASGMYAAPEFPPQSNSITVSAAKTSDATKTASAAVTLQNPVPQLSTISPTSIPVGSFTLTVNGAHFASGASVLFGTTALTTTRVSSTQLTAIGSATSSQVGNISVTVKNPDPGAISSGSMMAQVTANSGITVSVQPSSVTLRVGDTQSFTAKVNGSTNQSVTWSVNGITGGNATLGTVDANGNYRPPDIAPNNNPMHVGATSVADTSKFATSSATVLNPIPVLSTVNPSTIGMGAFMITVTGSKFISGATVLFGGQPLTTMFVSSTELTATGTATALQIGTIQVAVQNPDPGSAVSSSLSALVTGGGAVISAAAASRFLEQSTFGPTPETLNQVQQTGLETYLQGLFAAPVSTYPDPPASDTDLSKVQKRFFVNAVSDSGQLRLRLALALNEIWVVSGNKVSDPLGYTNYLRALHSGALGNYYDVMKDVTLTPAMGHFLDMVNNDKPQNGNHANENYARELMQLFTLGLSQLNNDGTPKLDGSGNPIPTYTQDDVMNLGRVLTGWTYPTQPGQTLQRHNPSYYGGPMLPFESNHDTGAKTLLGVTIPAGQAAGQDLDSALQAIFNHPNLPPFVCRQLIQKLVTSNPSPAYVGRAAAAFASGKFQSFGSASRGDMQATAAAILLDPEARRGDLSTTADPNDGKLREPVIMEVALARAFHATTDGSGFTGSGSQLAQNLFNAGSVFNFFPPDALIPGTNLFGPEFAIYNTASSLNRVNFINTLVYGQIASTTTLDFSPVIALAGTPDQMVDWLNNLFLHGSMSDPMKQSVLTAVNAVSSTDSRGRARAAIYLVAASLPYQVQH